jgi:acetyl-CoA carboxylase biotin carboxyl carrier protein
MNLKELKELIELVSEKGFTEFEVERQGFRLRISSSKAAAPAAPAAAPPAAPATQHELSQPQPQHPALPAAPAQPAADVEPGEASLHQIKAPMPGTFYRSPSPTAEPFVKVGDLVEPDSVICIIEAMKLMNNIEAEVSGVVAKIYVENGQPVEYGQPLFGIRA